jgi:hypothetical protein
MLFTRRNTMALDNAAQQTKLQMVRHRTNIEKRRLG